MPREVVVLHRSRAVVATRAAAALVLLAACQPSADPGRPALPTWSLSAEPTLAIGGPEAEGAHQLFRAFRATRLSDGRVVVADAGSQQVRIFAPDGRHLRTMGGKGGGPGKFQYLSWVGRFGPDSILDYDESMRRLVAYGPTGELAGSVTLSLPGTPRFPEIVGVYADGRQRPLRAEWTAPPVPAAEVQRWRDGLIEQAIPQMVDRIRPLLADVPHRPTYPAFAQLAMDPSGDYWVREYPRTPGAPNSWIVYAPTGTPRARLRTPPRFTVIEVGPDYVLGRFLDEMDVESVRVYGIER